MNTTPRPRRTACFLVAAVALFGVTGPAFADDDAKPAEAEEQRPPAPPLVMSVDHYTLAPKPLNQSERGEERIHADPTIVPFSGWCFFSKTGEAQPWRKRSAFYANRWHWLLGGQGHAYQEQPRLIVHWRMPEDADTDPMMPEFRNEAQAEFFTATGWTTQYLPNENDGPKLRSLSVRFDSIEDIPDHLMLKTNYRYGDWETVAKADASSEFPVGNDHMRLMYVGEPRSNGEVMRFQRMLAENGHENEQEERKHKLEVHSKSNYPKDRWDYRVQYYDKDGKEASPFTYGLYTGDDVYQLAETSPEEMGRIEIQRTHVATANLDAVELGGAVGIWPDAFVQQRIDVNHAHRFGEAKQLVVEPFAPGATCLVDLDAPRVARLPAPALEGDELTRFLHAEGIDLVIKLQKNGLFAEPVGCFSYQLGKAMWGSTPRECVNHVKKTNQHPRGYVLKADASPRLTTTAEGAMVLTRTAEVSENADDQTATLEVRQLVE